MLSGRVTILELTRNRNSNTGKYREVIGLHEFNYIIITANKFQTNQAEKPISLKLTKGTVC